MIIGQIMNLDHIVSTGVKPGHVIINAQIVDTNVTSMTNGTIFIAEPVIAVRL